MNQNAILPLATAVETKGTTIQFDCVVCIHVTQEGLKYDLIVKMGALPNDRWLLGESGRDKTWWVECSSQWPRTKLVINHSIIRIYIVGESIWVSVYPISVAVYGSIIVSRQCHNHNYRRSDLSGVIDWIIAWLIPMANCPMIMIFYILILLSRFYHYHCHSTSLRLWLHDSTSSNG